MCHRYARRLKDDGESAFGADPRWIPRQLIQCNEMTSSFPEELNTGGNKRGLSGCRSCTSESGGRHSKKKTKHPHGDYSTEPLGHSLKKENSGATTPVPPLAADSRGWGHGAKKDKGRG